MTSIDRTTGRQLSIFTGFTGFTGTRVRDGVRLRGLALAALVALGGCSRGGGTGRAADDPPNREPITTFEADLSAGTQKLVVTLPSSSTFSTAVLGASASLAIGDRATTKRTDGTFAQATNTGATASDLGADSQVGDVLSVAPLTLRDRAHVNGNATSAGAITRGNGTVVTGAVSPNTPIAADRLAWNVNFPTSGPDVTVPVNGARPLAPGSSGNVHAFSGATLSVRTGTYYMDSLFMEPQSHLAVNTTAGPVFIYLRQGFTFRGNTVFSGPSNGLVIGYTGTAAPAFDTSFDGTFVAPNAAVTLGVGATVYNGAVYAKSITVMPDVRLTQRVFSGWNQITFDVVPTFACVDTRADGSRAALLGYVNPNSQPVTVPIGAQNAFLPSPQDHGQPTTFLPGRFPTELSIDFGSATSLTWQLQGGSLAVAATATACPSSLTSALVQDTTVAASSPKANFGTSTTLTVGDDSHVLVQFDRAAIKKTLGVGRYVKKAVLTLTQTSGDQPPVDAMVVTRRWTEGGATWDCGNDTDASASGESCAPGTTWSMKRNDAISRNPWRLHGAARRVVGTWTGGKVAFDVTRDLGNLLGTEGLRHPPAWALVKQSGAAGAAVLASRESSTPPQLVLTVGTLPRIDPAGSQPLSYAVDTSIVPSPATQPPLADGNARTVSAILDAKGLRASFVDRELVFSIQSDAELAPVLARWNATVVQEIPPPANLPLPITAIVRIDTSRAQRDSLLPRSLQADNRPRGAQRVSSTTGIDTFAAGAEEVLAGRNVSLNWLSEDDVPTTENWALRDVSEGPWAGGSPPFPSDPFFWPGFASCDPDAGSNESPPPCLNKFSDGTPIFQFLNVGQAWRALALTGRLQAGAVRVGVVDGGFSFTHPDYPASVNAVQVLFSMTSQGNQPAHGTKCVLAGFAAVGDQFGAAGPGGPVATVDIYPTPENLPYDVANLAIAAAIDPITSISRSARISAGWDLLGYPTFSLATSLIRESGTLIFAAAGNRNQNVDAQDCFADVCWEEAHHEPCEDDGVDCVTGLAFNGIGKAAASSWGDETRTIAGLNNVVESTVPLAIGANGVVAPQVASGTTFSNSFALNFGGTSAATPFIAGIASLVSAAGPGRSMDDVEACLYATRHDAGDGFFAERADALAAITCMIGNAGTGLPGFLQIKEPLNGQTARVGDMVQFEATATDFDIGNGEIAIGWKSDIDGALGVTYSDFPSPLIFRTPGTHTVTATVLASGGEVLTATVTVIVTDPVADLLITTPSVDGFHTVVGIDTLFAGYATLPGLGTQPCDAFTWSGAALDGTPDFWGVHGCFIQQPFPTPGIHVVTLNFTDSQGRVSAPAVRTVDVTAPTGPFLAIVNPVDTQNAGIRVFYDVGQPVPLKAESNRTNVSYSWSVLIGSGTVTPVGNGATASYQPNATCNEKVELQVTMTDLDTNEQVTTFVTFFAESSSAGCVK